MTKGRATTRKAQELGSSSVASIIPSPIADDWGIGQGDELWIEENDDGSIRVEPCNRD